MKILQICFRVPYPPNDGGAMAMYSITKGLSDAGHEVTVLAVNTPKHYQPDSVLKGIAKLQTVFIDTKLSPFKAFFNLFKPYPYIVERFISRKFASALKKLLEEQSFDLVHFEGTFVSWYVDIVKKVSSLPVILRSHNLEFMIWERLAENEMNPLKKWYFRKMSKELKEFEITYLNKFDVIAAITTEDKLRMEGIGIRREIIVIPAGIEAVQQSSTVPEPGSCFILSALNWIPNQQALFWFLKNVWPLVLKELPTLKLHIAGKGTPEEFYSLQNENVKVHGFVEDARQFMYTYDLMLVPLLSGGGMRLKIIEGLALGKAIVSSPVGAEGIDCTDGKNILICSNPVEWANTIINYYKNKEKYKHLGHEAKELVREKYLTSQIISNLVTHYQKLIQ